MSWVATTCLLAVVIWVSVAYVASRGQSDRHSASQHTSTSAHAKSPANSQNAWKQYCDDQTHGCFSYPAAWHFSRTGDAGTNIFIGDYKGTLASYFSFSYPPDHAFFHTVSMQQLTGSNQAITLVGGFYVQKGPSKPLVTGAEYFLVDTATVRQYGLTVGKTTAASNWMSMKLTTAVSLKFYCGAENPAASQAAAIAWFNTPAAHTCEQVTRSFFRQ